MPDDGFHNAHMLIPRRLWTEAKGFAILEGTSMTDFVCEALQELIAKRKQDREESDG